MKRAKLAALSTFVLLCSSAATALADETSALGQDGQVILSAERLFGLTLSSISQEDGATHNKTTDSFTRFGLLWPSGVSPFSLSSPYEIPHAAIDFVVGSHVTVGGSLGFTTSSGTRTSEPQGGAKTERDEPSETVFVIQPRAGYVLALSDAFSFWPRAGLTYYNIHTEQQNGGGGGVTTTTKSTLSGFGIDLEAMFVYSPIAHFGITLSPLVDIPLTGSSSSEVTPNPTGVNPPDDTVKFMTFGATLGVLGYL